MTHNYQTKEEKTNPETNLFFARSGLQNKLLKQLKQGKLGIEARLDLHGMTWDEAKDALEEFLNECQLCGYRVVLIIPGKGHVLKSRLNSMLKLTPDVLAFCTAQPKHGGTGALYVILRRSREG